MASETLNVHKAPDLNTRFTIAVSSTLYFRIKFDEVACTYLTRPSK